MMQEDKKHFNSIYPSLLDIPEIKNRYIRWICENANGAKILIVGAEESTIRVLLKEGRGIGVIDSDESKLTKTAAIMNLEIKNQDDIIFKKIDILRERLDDDSFDTLIMTNTLEYSFYTSELLKKIDRLISPDGIFLLSVPFGVEKQARIEPVYNIQYGSKLLLDLNECFDVEEIEFISSSNIYDPQTLMTFACKKKGRGVNKKSLSKHISNIEYFYEQLQRRSRYLNDNRMSGHNDTVHSTGGFGEKTNFDTSRAISERDLALQEMKNEKAILSGQVNALLQENNVLKDKIKSAESKSMESNSKYNSLKNENADMSNKVKDVVNKLNKELKEEERILRAYDALNKEYERVYSRYENLVDTIWGRITVEYWRFLKNRPRN